MLTNRHIRIGFALLVSMGLHTTIMMSSMGLKKPDFFQQQKESVSMTLASRPVQRTDVPASKQKQNTKPVVKKKIKEIPAPQPQYFEETNPQTDEMETLTTATVTEPNDEQNSPDSNTATESTNIIEATPLYKKNPPPRYPSTARRRGYQGTAVLEVMVTESGLVQKINIFESSGYKVLDKAAIKAVTSWYFSPATRLGQPIAMWVKIPVQFVLR